MVPEVLVEPSEPDLEHVLPALPDLGGDGPRRGDQVARAQGEEHQGQGGDVPGRRRAAITS